MAAFAPPRGGVQARAPLPRSGPPPAAAAASARAHSARRQRALSLAPSTPSHLWLADLFRALQSQLQRAAAPAAAAAARPESEEDKDDEDDESDADTPRAPVLLSWELVRRLSPRWEEAVEQMRDDGLVSFDTEREPTPMMPLLRWIVSQPLQTCIELLSDGALQQQARLEAAAIAAAIPASPPAFIPPAAHCHSWLLLRALLESLPRSSRSLALTGAQPRVRMDVLMGGLREWLGIEAKSAPLQLLDMAEAKGELGLDELYLWWSLSGSFEYRARCSLRGGSSSSTAGGSFLYLYHFQHRLLAEQQGSGVSALAPLSPATAASPSAAFFGSTSPRALASSPTAGGASSSSSSSSSSPLPLSCVSLLSFMKVFSHFHPSAHGFQSTAETSFKRRLNAHVANGTGAQPVGGPHAIGPSAAPAKGLAWSEIISMLHSKHMSPAYRKSIQYRAPAVGGPGGEDAVAPSGSPGGSSGPGGSPLAASSSPTTPSSLSSGGGLLGGTSFDSLDWLRRFDEDEAAYARSLRAHISASMPLLAPFLRKLEGEDEQEMQGDSSALNDSQRSSVGPLSVRRSIKSTRDEVNVDVSFSSLLKMLLDGPVSESVVPPSPRLLRVLHSLRFLPHFFLPVDKRDLHSCTLRQFTEEILMHCAEVARERLIQKEKEERKQAAIAAAAAESAARAAALAQARAAAAALEVKTPSTGRSRTPRGSPTAAAGSATSPTRQSVVGAQTASSAARVAGVSPGRSAASRAASAKRKKLPRSGVVGSAAASAAASSSSTTAAAAKPAAPSALTSLQQQTERLKQCIAERQAESAAALAAVPLTRSGTPVPPIDVSSSAEAADSPHNDSTSSTSAAFRSNLSPLKVGDDNASDLGALSLDSARGQQHDDSEAGDSRGPSQPTSARSTSRARKSGGSAAGSELGSPRSRRASNASASLPSPFQHASLAFMPSSLISPSRLSATAGSPLGPLAAHDALAVAGTWTEAELQAYRDAEELARKASAARAAGPWTPAEGSRLFEPSRTAKLAMQERQAARSSDPSPSPSRSGSISGSLSARGKSRERGASIDSEGSSGALLISPSRIPVPGPGYYDAFGSSLSPRGALPMSSGGRDTLIPADGFGYGPRIVPPHPQPQSSRTPARRGSKSPARPGLKHDASSSLHQRRDSAPVSPRDESAAARARLLQGSRKNANSGSRSAASSRKKRSAAIQQQPELDMY